MTYEETPAKNYKKKKEIIMKKTNTPLQEARADYMTAKRAHKSEIKKLKLDIKRHKLLKAQAKSVYKQAKRLAKIEAL